MENWIHQIDKNTDEFTHHFGSLTSEQLNWKPGPDSWSIAQIINHLIIINNTYLKVLSDVREGKYKAPFLAKIRFIVSLTGTTVLNAVKPDRRKKMKTFQIWEPAKSDSSVDLLDRFERHQGELKKHIAASDDLIKRGTNISSPANRYIVFKLETAFDIIVTHEQRHLEQAKEILALLKRESGN